MTPPSPLPPPIPTARAPPWARKLGRKGLLFDVTEGPWGRSPQRRWTLGRGTRLNSALLLLGGAQARERGARGPPHWGYATGLVPEHLTPSRHPSPAQPSQEVPCWALVSSLGQAGGRWGLPSGSSGLWAGLATWSAGLVQREMWAVGLVRNHQSPSGGRWRAADPVRGPSECGLLRLPRSRVPDPSLWRLPSCSCDGAGRSVTPGPPMQEGQWRGGAQCPSSRSGSSCDLNGLPGCGAPASSGPPERFLFPLASGVPCDTRSWPGEPEPAACTLPAVFPAQVALS